MNVVRTLDASFKTPQKIISIREFGLESVSFFKLVMSVISLEGSRHKKLMLLKHLHDIFWYNRMNFVLMIPNPLKIFGLSKI